MKESINELILQYGPPRLIPAIQDNVRESLILRTRQVSEEQLPLGRTKIGGRPDLPNHIHWPTWQDKPLSFIAQINLADLPKYEFLNTLPSEGILSFFYSAEQETWGYNPKDKGSWRVIYLEDKGLQRQNCPSNFPNEGKYENCTVEFHHSVTIPNLESPYIDLEYGKSKREEIDQYINLKDHLQEFLGEGNRINRFLGHPEQQQNDMQIECQLVSHGLYLGDGSGHDDPKAKELSAGAKDWELLLQIDSDDNAKMMWGDVGCIYYWIQREDLQLRNFDSAWMVLQCG
ncbi:MAG: YwqG family protein [Anaerolineales bacterium]